MRVYHFATPALILSLANASKTPYYISMNDFYTEKTPQRLFSFSSLLRKLISIFLVIQSLYGLYESTKFILFDRMTIESAISEHRVNESSINFYMSKILLTAFNIFSLWFAVHLFGPKKRISKNLQMLIGILLIIANTYLMKFFSQLPILEQFWSLIDFS